MLWISENQKDFSKDRLKICPNSSSNKDNLIRGEGRSKNALHLSGIWGKSTTFNKFGALFCNVIGSILSIKVDFYRIKVDQTASEILGLSGQMFCS